MELEIKDKFTNRELIINIDGYITGILTFVPFLLLKMCFVGNNFHVLIFSFFFLSMALYHFVFIHFRMEKMNFGFNLDFGYLVLMITFAPIILNGMVFITALIKLVQPYL